MMKVVNVPDLSPKDDGFVCLETKDRFEWVCLSGLPSNGLERAIRTPRISRYRAALQAAMRAKSGDVVISHHPLMSAAVAGALWIMRRRVRHVAWAFNFTKPPRGLRLKILSKLFEHIDRFIVFSEYEKTLYPRLFRLEENRFHNVLWTQSCPRVDEDFAIAAQRPYVCAIGGEGRDIDLVLRAAAHFEGQLDFVLITRSYMLPKERGSSNLKIYTDLPPERTWAVALRSAGVLVPLVSDNTCCGHITIVSAKLLGLPLVTTSSIATEEYISGRPSVLVSAAGDLDSFCDQIRSLVKQQSVLQRLAKSAQPAEALIHSRELWSNVLHDVALED